MRIHNKAIPLTLLMCAIALAIAFVLHPHGARAAATYTVDSIGDEADDNPGDLACHTALDTCTLRAAIQEVNAGAGGDTINFGIAGTGVHTLTPATAYDNIAKSVTIDGYSQPGSVANTAPSPQPFNGTLTIEIDGTNAGVSAGLGVQANNVTIKGLVINRFGENGIFISTGNNRIITGNYIGTDPTGLIDRGNAHDGIGIYNPNNTGTVLGGTLPEDRNIISGNDGAGLQLNSNSNSSVDVKGNYFGLNASGTAVLPNDGSDVGGSNIWMEHGDNSTIGGPNHTDSNVISGSPSVGIGIFTAAGIKIQGNYIGTNPQGDVQGGFGNSLMGVILVGAANTLVGGVNSGEGNVISGNGAGVGISDVGGVILALNNSILGNNIHNNPGGSVTTLGIDLLGNTNDFATFSDAGVTANDAGDPDVTSNVLMNFPVIQSVTSTNGTATITYDLDINDAEPGATGYRVEFFANDSADPSGHGQGQTYIGSDTVSGDVTGKQVTITLPNGVDGSKYITATTTMTDASDDGFGHTSEFAADVQATLLPPTPTPGPIPTPKPSGNSTGASTLADTGQDTRVVEVVAIVLLISGFASTTYLLINKRKKHCG